jgi:hypothetical protein
MVVAASADVASRPIAARPPKATPFTAFIVPVMFNPSGKLMLLSCQ